MTPRALYDLVIPGVTVVEYGYIETHGRPACIVGKSVVTHVQWPVSETAPLAVSAHPASMILWPPTPSSPYPVRIWPRPGDEPIVLSSS